MDQLRNDPTLIRPAIEELLRFASPLETATERYAREDMSFGGVTIPRGEMVFAALASANRDERQFSDPDKLDIVREPNRHLTFGTGAHRCLGSNLARLELRIALQEWLRVMPHFRLADPAAIEWSGGQTRGPEQVAIVVESPGASR